MRRLRFVVRFRPPSSPVTPFVTLSLAFHLGGSAALAILPALHRAPVPKEDAWIVGLAALPGPPSRGGGASASAAPAPAPPRPREAVRIEEPKAQAKPGAKTEPKAAPPRPQQTAAPAADAPGSAAGPPGGSPAAGGGTGGPGGGIFSLGVGDARFAWYRASVTAALQSHWVRPVLEGVRETLSVTVTFEIARDGSVRDVAIETTSGVPSLDRSAVRAVEQASPLPPLPGGWDDAPFPARFEFRWSPGE